MCHCHFCVKNVVCLFALLHCLYVLQFESVYLLFVLLGSVKVITNLEMMEGQL